MLLLSIAALIPVMLSFRSALSGPAPSAKRDCITIHQNAQVDRQSAKPFDVLAAVSEAKCVAACNKNAQCLSALFKTQEFVSTCKLFSSLLPMSTANSEDALLSYSSYLEKTANCHSSDKHAKNVVRKRRDDSETVTLTDDIMAPAGPAAEGESQGEVVPSGSDAAAEQPQGGTVEQPAAETSEVDSGVVLRDDKAMAAIGGGAGIGSGGAAWGPWTDWTPCVHCGEMQTRTQQCTVYGGCYGAKENKQTQVCTTGSQAGFVYGCNAPPTTTPPPQWSEYGPWSPCTVTCGAGTHTRSRTCQPGGTGCPGEATQSEACNMPACPVLQPWSAWTPCSTTCTPGYAGLAGAAPDSSGQVGGVALSGTQTRTRDCSVAGQCTGMGTLSESMACGSYVCPQWSPWGAWAACSATCGTDGKQSRTRTCNVPGQCPGSDTDSQACNAVPCPTWNPWGAWAACSATCGTDGKQARTRTCTVPGKCPGSDNESQACNAVPCPTWNPWGAWATCSATCGTDGKQSRTRTCTVPGKCPGSDSDSQACNNTPCPVWNPWGAWATCSATCGTDGRQTRTRTCTVPGKCPGPDSDNQACNNTPCPVWNPWGAWATCSATCGTDGKQSRTRTCTVPGKCPGSDSDNQACNNTPCPVWNPWGAWATCSATCGTDGKQSRTRTCTVPGKCPGSDSENQACNNTPCPTWQPWTEWSPCPKTCIGGYGTGATGDASTGPGMQTRSRQCTVAGQCPGVASDQQQCGNTPCPTPPPPVYGAWSAWSPCSATCGDSAGDMTRSRTCSMGAGCVGEPQQTQACPAVAPCPKTYGDPAFSKFYETRGNANQPMVAKVKKHKKT